MGVNLDLSAENADAVYYENPATTLHQYVGPLSIFWAFLFGPLYYFGKKAWYAFLASIVVYVGLRVVLWGFVVNQVMAAGVATGLFLLAWMGLSLLAPRALDLSYRKQGWKRVE